MALRSSIVKMPQSAVQFNKVLFNECVENFAASEWGIPVSSMNSFNHIEPSAGVQPCPATCPSLRSSLASRMAYRPTFHVVGRPPTLLPTCSHTIRHGARDANLPLASMFCSLTALVTKCQDGQKDVLLFLLVFRCSFELKCPNLKESNVVFTQQL